MIGSRESKLAVVQTEIVCNYIRQNCPGIELKILTMKTTGDKILDRKLADIGGKGLFVKELDMALLEGKAHLCVHSLKDLPAEIPKNLPLLGFSEREDPRDVLVLPQGISELRRDKPIGCSSERRILQLKKIYPDMEASPVRGNVLTRLKKLDSGGYSALVLAAAGLKRLGLANRISRYFSTEEMVPAAGQGVLAVQGRVGEDYGFMQGFFHQETTCAVLAERAFVSALDGGCSSPVAAYARIEGEELILKGFYFGTCLEIKGNIQEGEILGQNLAKLING